MRRCGILVAVGLALSGCKYLDKTGRDDRPPSGSDRGLFPASGRKKDRDEPPAVALPKPDPHWLDGPASRTGRGDLPPSPTGRSGGTTPVGGFGGEARDSGPDQRGDGQGMLAGYVTDEFGRKLRGVYLTVAPADRTETGAPTGVETSEDGSFQIYGLRSGQTYILSAKTTTRDGVTIGGEMYTRPPNPRILLPLKEGFSLPGRAPSGPPGEDLGTLSRPGSGRPKPLPLAGDRAPVTSSGDGGRSDGSWSPTNPAPLSPKLDEPPARPQGRPELTTNIPPPDRSPSVLPGPTDADPGQRESRSVRPRSEFVLVDTLGRPKDFPTGRAGELVLMEFMTTTCLPCKKAVPALKDLQARYGARGLDVIGVACDEVDTPQRRAVAGGYQREHDLNYLLYVEPGNRPGQVMARFGVEWYPTMVLINSAGDVLWKGDPRDLGPLERVIDENLGK